MRSQANPLFHRLILPVVIISLFGGAASGRVRKVYQHPLPGAAFVSPGTNIAIRLDGPWLSGGSGQLPEVSLRGSVSGRQPSRLSVSDDGSTLLVTPARRFAQGETVDVTVKDPVPIEGLRDFRFTVGRPGEYHPLKTLEDETGGRSVAPVKFRTAESDTLPLDFPYLSTVTEDTNAPGKIFLSNLSFTGPVVPYLMIVGNSGRPVFYRKMNAVCTDFKVQPNGQLTYFETGINKFFAMDSQYNVVDSFATGNGYTTDIHEMRLLPNGHALLLAYDPETVDMRGVAPGGDSAATVTGLIVQEIDSQKQVVFEWRSWDHFQITDATHENLTAHAIDYVHGNALELDSDGNIILSSRHMDEITKIDRQTGGIVWRMGGKNNQFTFTNDSIGYSHQHGIRRLPNGHLILFDNGNFHSPQFSRAAEYAVDEAGKTATLVWQYRHSPDVYGQAMGYAQRLDNGNTLIGWGAANPSVTEVSPDGSVAFELTLANGIYSYRAYRFPWKESQSQGPVSLPSEVTLYQNYPNPFNPGTRILVALAKAMTVTFSVYDVSGRLVRTYIDHEPKSPGNYYIDFDGSRLASGTYYYQLITDRNRTVRRMELVR